MGRLCVGADDLENGDVRLVDVQLSPPWRSIIVSRIEGQLVAYWNVCRHLPVPLDGGTRELEGTYWTCMTHGARFQPSDGMCISGPCEGLELHRVPVDVEEGQIWVKLEVPAGVETS